MGWLGRHWPGMLATVMIASLAFGVAVSLTSPPTRMQLTNDQLATALGDTGDWSSVTCSSQSGTVDHVAYNRRCLRTEIDGFLCDGNTDVTTTAIFLRVRDDRYHIVDANVVSAHAC